MTRPFWTRIVMLAILAMPMSVGAADALTKLRSGLSSGNADQQAEAVERVRELGPSAATLTPDLIKLLATDDLALKVEVITALGEIGEDAGAAATRLLALTHDKSVLVRHAAWIALGQMAQAWTPPEWMQPGFKTPTPGALNSETELNRGMKDPEPIVRIVAAEAALKSVPHSPGLWNNAIVVLEKGLNSDSTQHCRESAQAMVAGGSLGVPRLTKAVQAANPKSLLPVLEALTMLRGDSHPALSAIIALKPGDDAAVAAAQARALGAIASDAKMVLPVLTGLAGHSSPSVRVASITALGTYPTAAEATVPLLVKALQDKEVSVRLAAIDALGAHGSAAKAAVPALDAALADPIGAVTIRAAEALAMIGGASVPVLVKRLDDPDYGELVLQTIGQMGSNGATAAPQLVERLSKPGKLSLRELCVTLAFIKADPKVAGAPLQKIASDSKNPARPAAIYALGSIGDKSALKLITNAVEDEDPVVQLGAAWALLQLDPKNADFIEIAVPRLAFGLERPDPRVRKLAAETLGQLGSAAAAAVPALAKRIGEDDDPLVRANCALALAQMGDASRTAVPALVRMLQSEPAGGRRAVLFALGNLGPVAIDALPDLRKAALEGPVFDRTLAAWAVLKVRADQQEIEQMTPVLMNRLRREQPEAAVQLIQMLGELGKDRPEIIHFLDGMKSLPDQRLREAAEAAHKKATAK